MNITRSDIACCVFAVILTGLIGLCNEYRPLPVASAGGVSGPPVKIIHVVVDNFPER